MKKLGIVVALTLTLRLALAHEFWLEPTQFFARVGSQLQLTILVGENFTGEPSEGKKNRIIQYRHQTRQSSTDLAPTLIGDTYGKTAVTLKTEGTHLFSFANTPKFLAMRADSFLLYLKEDGLDNVIAARQQRNEMHKPSRELYQRCVKTLVQVGATVDDTYAKNTGMALEIIPVKNPYAQRPGQQAEFQILFQQKPLAGALVRYWNRDPTHQIHTEQQRSDATGRVQFPLRVGSTMVSLVRMIPNADTTEADWHSYWGSLTFGCR